MLSIRGSNWGKVDFAHGKKDVYNFYTNPNGVVSFANAENWLLHDDLSGYFNQQSFDRQCCAYGEGYTGTLRLRSAMAKHLNTHFKAFTAIDAEEVTFAAGVTSLNELCAFILCNPNESILLVGPVYGAFYRDLTTRTSVHLEYVHVGDKDQFSPDGITAIEAEFQAAEARGRTIKALIICNPHNPLGRCYPRESLVGLLRLCASKGIHLISDEIYALSVYKRYDRPSEAFMSVRSIDFTGIINPDQVHVLYGMSKDFGAGGLRLGCLISQNDELNKATRALCRFSSPSQFSMSLAATMLEDQEFIEGFLHKSHTLLLQNRLLAEELLREAGIGFHDKGNSGLFVWIDLSAHLPSELSQEDAWAAERLLSHRLELVGVIMSTGEQYHAPEPGWFRLVFCVSEETLREGIRRISALLKE
ncbi:acc synthase [Penicillium frequentans]|nr:acc synthase [Penicillium glabrum]